MASDDMLGEYLRRIKQEEKAKELPANREWYLYFLGMLTKPQKMHMFERKLHESKINSFLVSVFALTGTIISAYETQIYIEANNQMIQASKVEKGETSTVTINEYTANREEPVNLGLRMVVTLTTAITSRPV